MTEIVSPDTPRVLVVDDVEDTRELLLLEFDLAGFAATAVENGADALDLVARERPHAIVLDLMMPGIDGWEVARRLRADPRTAVLPIVAFTAWARATDLQRARDAGVSAIVTKPAPAQVVVGQVRRLLGRPTVLVVDDVESARYAYQRGLGLHGFITCGAADGLAAIDRTLRVRPDALLLDIVMPGVDGLETARRIKADARIQRTPIVAISAQVDHRFEVEARAAGCAAFLTMPLAPPRIADAIQQAIQAPPGLG